MKLPNYLFCTFSNYGDSSFDIQFCWFRGFKRRLKVNFVNIPGRVSQRPDDVFQAQCLWHLINKKICIYLGDCGIGGSQRTIINLANTLNEMHFSLDLLVGDDKGPAKKWLNDGISYKPLGITRQMYALPKLVKYFGALNLTWCSVLWPTKILSFCWQLSLHS